MFTNIRRVEIELHSFCNRQCPWCPNKDINRKFYQELNEEIFIKTIKELKENNFEQASTHIINSKIITFNRFSEPMSHIELLKKRIKQARKIIPKVIYSINTNGDFLTKENLKGLNLNQLNIMDYDNMGAERCRKRLMDAEVIILGEENNLIIGTHKNIDKIMYFVDWPENFYLEDRAGILKNDIFLNDKKLKWKDDKKIRTEPCIEPRDYISIDYLGNVTPCCHIRSDYKEHEQYVMGNIYISSLKEIYQSYKWSKFRETMLSGDYENYYETCKNCAKYRKDERLDFKKCILAPE